MLPGLVSGVINFKPMMEPNFISASDFYKSTHWKQYPKGMTSISSYAEARVGAEFKEIVFAGLIPILHDNFIGRVVTREKIGQAEKLIASIGGYKEFFNKPMWEHILNEYDGYLPLEIKALEEGTVVKPGIPLYTITTTDKKCVPLVNHSETLLSHMWSATTVASMSRYIRVLLTEFAEQSGSPEIVPFMLHDFGFRGVSSYQTAVHAGMAHLISFVGTDTNEAVRAIQHYYPGSKGQFGASVWATEHSVATSFGPGQGEYDYVNHQLDNAPDDAIISLVADSYDVFNFAQRVIGSKDIKNRIISRKGRVVIRPDSGDPLAIVPQLLDILSGVFGFKVNRKGYKVINSNVGVLQGDGMDITSIPELYSTILKANWSSDNLVVGSGGGLLQKWNRDTIRFAIKASYGELNGVGFDIFKDPQTANTGNETKASKKGRIKIQELGNLRHTIHLSSRDKMFDSYVDSLQTIFLNGKILTDRKFEDIKAKALL